MVVKVTDSDFNQQVISDSGVVLVDFWAPWCGPCQMLGPIVEQLSQEYAGQAKVLKLNVDENQRIAGQYGIMGIPTMLVFKNGRVVEKLVGLRPKALISATLDKWMRAA